MAHVEKYTRSQVGQLFAHYERKGGRNFGNPEINHERTHQNYNLVQDTRTLQERYRDRISEIDVYNRADVKTMCNWVVTLPKDMVNESDECIRNFFEHSFDFLQERYGAKNTVSAYVHMDETTPHMHFSFVPVVKNLKTGKEKCSAKEVLTRKDLQSFHVDLRTYLEEQMNREVNVLNDATREGNRTIRELKQANKELESEIEKLRNHKKLNDNCLQALQEKPQKTVISTILNPKNPDYILSESKYKTLINESILYRRLQESNKNLKNSYTEIKEKAENTQKELDKHRVVLRALHYYDLQAPERDELKAFSAKLHEKQEARIQEQKRLQQEQEEQKKEKEAEERRKEREQREYKQTISLQEQIKRAKEMAEEYNSSRAPKKRKKSYDLER